jgi:hypothetical protein
VHAMHRTASASRGNADRWHPSGCVVHLAHTNAGTG